jgi:sulfide:quinone oxidoreductase
MAGPGGVPTLGGVERCEGSEPAIGSRARIAIVGGGVAGLEAMLALRELLGDQVEIELYSPRREFAYRPLAVGEPFGGGRVLEYDLGGLTERAGAAFRLASVLSVDEGRRRIVTRDDARADYDRLVIAPGARMLTAFPGAITFWGVPDEGGVGAVARGLLDGTLRRVVFTIPASSWPFPAYELALLADRQLRREGVEGAELLIVTPEDAPLRLFGARASEWVSELLAERGIEAMAGVHPLRFEDGLLQVVPGAPIEADAVVSAARLEGRRIAGLPSDHDGFIPVDGHGRVLGMEAVFAAGDITTFPVKQGGIATQQADLIAETIAAELRGTELPRPFDPVLRGTLWTGEQPRFLYSRLTGGHGETSIVSERALWEHEGKIVGRYLAPFLERETGGERPGEQTGVVQGLSQ